MTRGQKQGDKLSPLLFNLIFNALLIALKAASVCHKQSRVCELLPTASMTI